MYILRGAGATCCIARLPDTQDFEFRGGEIIRLAEESIDKTSGQMLLKTKRKVGVVQVIEGRAQFVYTDEKFKQSIDYNEKTGYSSLDGGNLTSSQTGETRWFSSAKAPVSVPVTELLRALGFLKEEAPAPIMHTLSSASKSNSLG